MTELKPCPFCGSYAIRIAKDKLPDGGYIYDARCTNCGCGSPFRCTEEEVVEAWNKRVPPTTKQIEEYIEKTHKENMEQVADLKRKYL